MEKWLDKYQDGGKTRSKKLSENDKHLYKIDRALQLGYTPDSTGHMSSRDYLTGEILKYPAHPTFNKSINADKELGYYPMMDPMGKIYTINPKDLPKEGYFSPNKNPPSGYHKMPDGTIMKNSDMQDGGEITPRKFTERYLQSPKFIERLTTSGYNPEEEQLERLKNVEGVRVQGQYGQPSLLKQLKFETEGIPYTSGGSSYLPGQKAIVVDHEQAKKYNIAPDIIEAHEFGHAETYKPEKKDEKTEIRSSRLNEYENKNIINRLLNTANPTYKKNTDEIKSDINALRYELLNKGIYDAGYEDLDLEDLQRLDDSYIKGRLLKNYSEDDLIWLMNNIAMNNNSKLQKTNEFSNFTNSNWLEKYT